MVREENLDFWIENGFNVLFMGHAGVGKTSIVKAAFERHNLNWRYFSAATMDPWVDLVGVPKERVDELTGEAYLDLIRPKGLDQVEAIFIDEFNRSHKKVRNACMELLQFKTINGKPFPNLKIIWSAINPETDEYDVEKLDAAQVDRFHCYVDIPYKPDQLFFASRYGDQIARAAVSWWNALPPEIQRDVSPRRLDYALDIHSKQGDINFVLPEQSNVSKLLAALKHGPIEERLNALYRRKDPEEARKFLASENTYQAAIEHIKKSEPKKKFFLPLVTGERLSALAADPTMLRFMLKNCESSESFSKVICDIYEAKQNSGAVTEIKKAIQGDKAVAEALGYDGKGSTYRQWPMGSKPQGPFVGLKEDEDYTDQVEVYYQYAKSKTAINTADRLKIYDYVETYIPKKMSSPDAMATLRLLDLIVKRSQYTTLQKLDNLVGLFNQCIDQIHRNEGRTLSDIIKRYSTNYFQDLWKTIRENKDLSARVIPCGAKGAA